jgi:uncharacterized protein
LTSRIPPRDSLEPVPRCDRIETLDVVRGFALFGILLVNMELFSWPVHDVLMGKEVWTAPVDVITDHAVRFFAEGKFYALFSFLFGLGAMLQMERTEARQVKFAGFFCRRMLVLLGIGLLHSFLIWEGDILTVYALLGFLLLAFRKRKPKTLLVWAAICLITPILIYGLIWLLIALVSLLPEAARVIEQEMAKADAEYARLTQENLRVFARGSVAEVFLQRARNVAFLWQVTWFGVPMVFAMFLLGLYAGRRRLFSEVEGNLGFIRRLLSWGLCVGVPVSVIYVIAFGFGNPSVFSFVWVIVIAGLAIGGPALCFAYAAAITLLLRGGRWRAILRPMAAPGRMALSNYLFQSLVCTTIFYSYGFGLYGSVARALGVALAIGIYAAQLALSVWWLKYFRFGPAEWLWRTLTYGKRQPLRL